MTKNLFKLILFATIITPTLAVGQLPPKQLKESGQWVAFKYGQNKDKVCYVSSIPIKMTGKLKKTGWYAAAPQLRSASGARLVGRHGFIARQRPPGQ